MYTTVHYRAARNEMKIKKKERKNAGEKANVLLRNAVTPAEWERHRLEKNTMENKWLEMYSKWSVIKFEAIERICGALLLINAKRRLPNATCFLLGASFIRCWPRTFNFIWFHIFRPPFLLSSPPAPSSSSSSPSSPSPSYGSTFRTLNSYSPCSRRSLAAQALVHHFFRNFLMFCDKGARTHTHTGFVSSFELGTIV